MIETEFGRHTYNLGGFSMPIGAIGRLTTLKRTSVVAGDVLDYSVGGVIKLDAMRHPLSLDPRMEVFTFFVPHRHIYGDAWIELFKNKTPIAGSLESVPRRLLNSLAFSTSAVQTSGTRNVNRHIPQGYLNIYNNYFKDSTRDADIELADYYADDSAHSEFGLATYHPPNMWSAPLPDENGAISMNVGNDSIGAYELQEFYADYHTDRTRELFMNRYRDIMDFFGGGTTADVDQRPTLLGRTSQFFSGYDVDGTDQASLGHYAGRSMCKLNHSIPSYLVQEHGQIWTVCVIRYPAVVVDQNDLLDIIPPTYDFHSCDPAIIGNHAPVDISSDDLFSGDNNNVGFDMKQPYGQWFRKGNSFIHGIYKDFVGYPFLTAESIGYGEKRKIDSTYYDRVFSEQVRQHWHGQISVKADIKRAIPSARTSALATE